MENNDSPNQYVELNYRASANLWALGTQLRRFNSLQELVSDSSKISQLPGARSELQRSGPSMTAIKKNAAADSLSASSPL